MKTVCILTAGVGSRMGRMGEKMNKALLPLDGKAVLSHLFERFPSGTHFVIAVGYLGAQVRDYVRIAHPELSVDFVEVDRFEGIGSGPGYSLLCCRELLQKPFYFLSCDTLFGGRIEDDPTDGWLGVSRVPAESSASYCNFHIEDEKIVSIYDKVFVSGNPYRAFVGLGYIRDYAVFWSGLETTHLIAGEHQVSNGIAALVRSGENRVREVDWTDVGSETNYKKLIQEGCAFDFSKTDEFIYFVNGKVVKFFADPKSVRGRVRRASLNEKVFPKITDVAEQFYGYKKAPGDTFYSQGTPDLFAELLEWLHEKLWVPQNVDPLAFQSLCHAFYFDKTHTRLGLYYAKYNQTDASSVVNGDVIPTTAEIFDRIPWESLKQGDPVFFHGDLQFDNVLVDVATEDFLLLDWRQDFAGNTEYGDRYYDLAKLYGGIVLNYDYIKKNLMCFREKDGVVDFDFATRYQSRRYLSVLESFVERHRLDLRKIKIIVGLIYINMSPLHEAPFDKLLYSLGRSFLWQELQKPCR
ncbi:MAG: NTP transferase domain-containing protein [Verrucomicrobiota bacterium]